MIFPILSPDLTHRIAKVLRRVRGQADLSDMLVENIRNHRMTDAEIEAQRQSLARGLSARCEHGRADFEQCPKCRCPHRVGDYIFGWWVCGSCYSILDERPRKLLPQRGKLGGPQQVVAAGRCLPVDGVSFCEFVEWMVVSLGAHCQISVRDAAKMCLEALEAQGEPFGSPDALWTRDAARELVNEAIVAYFDDVVPGANT